jgi:flagellar FliL protein
VAKEEVKEQEEKNDKKEKTEEKEESSSPSVSILDKVKGSELGVVGLALVIINTLGILTVIYLTYYTKFAYHKPTITDKKVMVEIEEQKDKLMDFIDYKLEPFTVNLNKSPYGKFVNTKFTLLAVDYATKDELDKKIDKVRDSIISILNKKYPEELSSIQGKLFLKDQIVTTINGLLEKGSIREVYIETFIIQ